MSWKKGRGKLGPLKPLLGEWVAESDTPMGRMKITRHFEPFLNGKFVKLTCHWTIPNKPYTEHCLFGTDREGNLRFWSFQSDGKQSDGEYCAAPDLPEGAIAFEADMPGGRARQAYWEHTDGGFVWAVENKTKKGWNRFVEHHYQSV